MSRPDNTSESTGFSIFATYALYILDASDNHDFEALSLIRDPFSETLSLRTLPTYWCIIRTQYTSSTCRGQEKFSVPNCKCHEDNSFTDKDEDIIIEISLSPLSEY